MRLSNRERRLVYILFFVLAISICGKYLALPALDRIDRSKIAIDETQEEEQKVILTSEQAKEIEDMLYTELTATLEERYFYYDIDDVYVDRLLQENTKKHKIEITKLSFLGDGASSTSEYNDVIIDMIMNIFTQRTKIYEEGNFIPEESLEYFSGTNQISENREEDLGYISPLISCRIDIEGKLDDIIEMVDQMNNSYKSIHVSSIEGDVTLGNFNGNIRVDLYYFN